MKRRSIMRLVPPAPPSISILTFASLFTIAPSSGFAQEPAIAIAIENRADGAAPPAKKGPGTKLDKDCLVCHAGVGEEDAPKLDLDVYDASVHAKEGCVGCHADVTEPNKKHEEEDQDLDPVDCGSCHEDAGAKWRASVHAVLPADVDREQATCARCHGSHDILSPKDPRSTVHPMRQFETCGVCHGLERVAAGHTLEVPPTSLQILREGTQREAMDLVRQGVEVSGCSDCHSSHAIMERTDPGSSLYPSNVSSTCRPCHEREAGDYDESAHGQASKRAGFLWAVNQDGDVPTPGEYGPLAPGMTIEKPSQPPVCSTCHVIHSRPPPKTDRFRLDVVRECGTCHTRLMETYSESYHGKATLLGDVSVAKCSDCHTAHRNLPPSDPKSSVSPENRLGTCRKCHADAPDGFESFWPHADPHDRENYPALFWIYMSMTTLLVSVFTFFGLHTLLWAIRDTIEAIRERGRARHQPTGAHVVRFSLGDRVTHFFVIVSFLGLAATGTPLKFAHTEWAPAVFDLFGGVVWAGRIHRFFAIVTFGYFASHLAHMAVRLARLVRDGTVARALIGPDSIVPQPRDIADIFRNLRYFVGLGPKPTWERWTYWEKFDYWAVFWGVAIIGSSGLVLWFPTFFTQIIPGWMVNVALVVHSDEALMAIGFIFGVHFFNSHLRRAKFPMDSVIFVGTVPELEFREERGLEWARLADQGALEARKGSAPNPIFLRWIRVFGIGAWLLGLIILFFIIHGYLFAKG